jgi:Putative metallopeptidase
MLAASAPQAAWADQQIEIAYEEPTSPELVPIYQQIKALAALQQLQLLMEPLRLPKPIKIRTAECGPNVEPYAPGGPVTICYEVLDQVAKLVKRHSRDPDYQQVLLNGAFVQTALHNISLAIFDVLGVPIWGREFDAADRLAALIMTQFGEDVTVATVESTTQIFQWSDRTWTGRDFASTNSPDAQRFYNYLCITYAAAPYDYDYLVRGATLPKDRAERCDGEYQQIKKAFNLRITPYVDPDLLVKARARHWSITSPHSGSNG